MLILEIQNLDAQRNATASLGAHHAMTLHIAATLYLEMAMETWRDI
jgi:hypothetical protein